MKSHFEIRSGLSGVLAISLAIVSGCVGSSPSTSTNSNALSTFIVLSSSSTSVATGVSITLTAGVDYTASSSAVPTGSVPATLLPLLPIVSPCRYEKIVELTSGSTLAHT